MSFRTVLRLGRVSNLPTVWTNALAGAVLATGAVPAPGPVLAVAFALSLFYLGGMWLNDAFDAEIDQAERKERPIPAGEIGRSTVFAFGWMFLAAGVVAGFLIGPGAGLAAVCLALVVTLYNWMHKKTSPSPIIMGAARFLCYALAALAVARLSGLVLAAGAGLFACVIGLTYAAKKEAANSLGSAWPLAVLALPVILAILLADSLTALLFCAVLLFAMAGAVWRLLRREPGDVPRAVVTLIAGISLYDAALIAGAGFPALALTGLGGFALTLALQRFAPGT